MPDENSKRKAYLRAYLERTRIDGVAVSPVKRRIMDDWEAGRIGDDILMDVVRVVTWCDPEEIWECDVGLIRDLNVEARAFLVIVSRHMCPPIPGVEVICVRADRFEDARRREGSLVEAALRGGKLVYLRPVGEASDADASCHVQRLLDRAKAAGLQPIGPEEFCGPLSEREIARLERLMQECGFPEDMISERVSFWRRKLESQSGETDADAS